MRIAPALVLLLSALPAWAQRASVAPFTGPGAGPLRDQIVSGVCVDPVTCVSQNKVVTGGKPDWKKAKKEKVGFIVTGKVAGKGGKQTLELQLLTKAGGAPKLKKSYAFSGSELSDKTLSQAIAALDKAMGVAPPPAEEPKKEPPPVVEEPKKEPPPEEKPVVVAKRPTEAPPPPKDDERASEEKDEKKEDTEDLGPAPKIKDPIVAIDVAAFLGTRSFSYSNVGTPNLRSYSAPFMFAPALKVEFYPLALVMKGVAAGLGIEAGYTFAVGLKSRRSGTDVTYPTSASKFDFGVRWRFRPIATSGAAVIASVGYRLQSFSVGAGSDGSTLDGLPAIAYSAIRPGISGELPFGETGLLAFGGFGVMIVLSSGEIISPAYFKSGSAFGVEFNLGVGYRIIGPLEVRASFVFQRYGLSFKTDPAVDTYVADGAVDQYLGGNVGVRLTF